MTYYLILFTISLLPALFWLYLFYHQDGDKEPWSLVIKAFFLGSLMVLPAGILEAPITPLLGGASLFAMTFLLGLFEETLKLLPILLFIYPQREFDEVLDGILYVLAAGLGFAFLENLLYALLYGIQVGLIRAVFTSLAHATFSGILGFYLGLSIVYPQRTLSLLIGGLLRASFLHGLYNFLLLGGFISFPVLLFSILVLQVYLFYLLKEARLLGSY